MTSIMKSKTNERAKFMEGATWIAIKSDPDLFPIWLLESVSRLMHLL